MTDEIERLFTAIKDALPADTPNEIIASQIGKMVSQQIITDEIASKLISKLQSHDHQQIAQDCATPRLLVDWGDTPRVGHQVRPEFSLLCPGFLSRPEVNIEVDQDLDHDTDDRRRNLRKEDAGLWSFHVPFRMTTNEFDCRPGQYLIDVAISFREAPLGLPRFYRSRIRLTVPSLDEGSKGVLEIDGDGQSIVNLQGYDLKQFSKVVLKSQGAGVINLQQLHGAEPDVSPQDQPDTPKVFEYELKTDGEKESRLPTLFRGVSRRTELDKAGLYFEDGRRILLLTGRRITFGRNRDNDVTLRFLPSCKEHDDYTLTISRTHFRAEMAQDGLDLVDESRSGLELNYSVVNGRAKLDFKHAGEFYTLNVGVPVTVPQPLSLKLVVIENVQETDGLDQEFLDEIYCDTVNGKLSNVWRMALDARINAIRLERENNLPDECYVLLYREALIGGSPLHSAVVLDRGGPTSQARIMHIDRSFWLEPLQDNVPVSVDGASVAVRTLVPLSPGMQIQIGDSSIKFDFYRQSYLD